MDVAALYFEVGALKVGAVVSCDRAQCGEQCIKGKQDTVNGDCTVCDLNPWRVVAALM